MNRLVIIGAGGMGRTMYDMARESVGYGEAFVVKGFVDDNVSALNGFEGFPPILGTIRDYVPDAHDVFVCAVGGDARRQCIEEILGRGGRFLTMIHRTARVGTNVQIGEGTVIGAFTTIGAGARVGRYNLIQSYSIVAHDCRVGDWNRIDTHVTLVGGTTLENGVDVYTGAVVNHGVVVESGARVAACSFVIRRVKCGTTVMGNPAKVWNF